MRKFGVVMAISMLIAACGGSTPAGGSPAPAATTEADLDITGPVTITLWHALTSDPQKGALEAAVKKFNDTNGKGITVQAVVQGNYTQLYQKTLGAIQAGALPDLAHAYESFVADYTKADVVVDLDPYVNSKKNGLDQASKDDIYKPYFDTNRFAQYGNKLLSFPFTKSLALMYTNEDVLKAASIAAPKTWDEWEQAVIKATKKDANGKTTQYGYAGTSDASYFNAMVLSRGGKLMSDDNKTVAWDGKEGLATLQMLKRLYDGGYAYTPTNFDWQNDFAQSKLAFTFGSTSSRPFIAAAMKTPVNWNVGAPPGGKTVMFGANVAVFKSTPQKQLASWLFIKWFSEQDNTADWATKSYYMPVRKSAANSEVLKTYWSSKDPQGKQAYDTIGNSIPEPNVRGQQDIRDVLLNMYVSVMTGKATPDQAIKDAGAKANQILKDAQ
ncbi:MAG TPA: ABC transporter substrate-binding protein [Candidatus Limnocylindria bacterium]|nr:ABC transporter substrate-binding protein [Candidatus Limnocylindria bacterium]